MNEIQLIEVLETCLDSLEMALNSSIKLKDNELSYVLYLEIERLHNRILIMIDRIEEEMEGDI